MITLIDMGGDVEGRFGATGNLSDGAAVEFGGSGGRFGWKRRSGSVRTAEKVLEEVRLWRKWFEIVVEVEEVGEDFSGSWQGSPVG